MSRRATTWLLTVALLVGGTAVGIRAQEAEDEEARAERAERHRTVRMVGPMVRARLASSGGWLGVRVEDVDEERADELGLAGARGALVEGVEEESPAAEAGLQEGDVIVSFDGEPIEEMDELPRLVARSEVGKEVDVGVIRDGERETVEVTLGELEQRTASKEQEPGEEGAAAAPAPPHYFNTGCCSFLDGDVTGFELADGEIRLIRWPDNDGAPSPQVLRSAPLGDVYGALREDEDQTVEA